MVPGRWLGKRSKVEGPGEEGACTGKRAIGRYTIGSRWYFPHLGHGAILGDSNSHRYGCGGRYMGNRSAHSESIGETEVTKACTKLTTLGMEGNDGILSPGERRFRDVLTGCKG